MATVVVVFSGVSPRSSIPALASVMTASVVSGRISETAPTNVVLPTPKPPATTIFVEVRPRPEPAKSTEHPFEQSKVRLAAADELWHVQSHQPFVGHVGDQDPCHSEGDPEQRGDLRDRSDGSAERS